MYNETLHLHMNICVCVYVYLIVHWIVMECLLMI